MFCPDGYRPVSDMEALVCKIITEAGYWRFSGQHQYDTQRIANLSREIDGYLVDRLMNSSSLSIFTLGQDSLNVTTEILRSFAVQDGNPKRKFMHLQKDIWRVSNEGEYRNNIQEMAIMGSQSTSEQHRLEDELEQGRVWHQYAGWHLIVSIDDFPNFDSEVTRLKNEARKIYLSKDNSVQKVKTRGRGRPNLTNDALNSYDSLYPHGHGNLTWEQVARKIEQETGVSIRAATLSRAFNNREKP